MNSPCQPHRGHIDAHGYGVTMRRGKKVKMHRLAFVGYNVDRLKEIEGILIRHTCDNPACVNPEHLIAGTSADNMRDKVERNRQIQGEQAHNSKLTDDSVRDIRANYVKGSKDFSLKHFATKYGCSIQVIHAVVNNKIWRHIN